MPTPTADRTYHVVRFERRVEAAAFVAALSRFLDSPRGSAYMAQPYAVEVWIPTPVPSEQVEVYLNDAARNAVIAGFNSVPVIDTRLGAALPPGCTLVLGDGRAPAWGLLDAERHLPTN